MSKNILLAVDAASHDPARHVLAAAGMTRELSRDSGDHVIVLHVHEFATGRFGRRVSTTQTGPRAYVMGRPDVVVNAVPSLASGRDQRTA
jgi:hypothetical protein